jgi:hypothetical protein
MEENNKISKLHFTDVEYDAINEITFPKPTSENMIILMNKVNEIIGMINGHSKLNEGILEILIDLNRTVRNGNKI